MVESTKDSTYERLDRAINSLIEAEQSLHNTMRDYNYDPAVYTARLKSVLTQRVARWIPAFPGVLPDDDALALDQLSRYHGCPLTMSLTQK